MAAVIPEEEDPPVGTHGSLLPVPDLPVVPRPPSLGEGPWEHALEPGWPPLHSVVPVSAPSDDTGAVMTLRGVKDFLLATGHVHVASAAFSRLLSEPDEGAVALYLRRVLCANDGARRLLYPFPEGTEMPRVRHAADGALVQDLEARQAQMRAVRFTDETATIAEYFVGPGPYFSVPPFDADADKAERGARTKQHLFPHARGGHGAMHALRAGTVVMRGIDMPIPAGWRGIFDAPRLMPFRLPPVWVRHLQRLAATAGPHPLWGVARVTTALAFVGGFRQAVEREQRLFQVPQAMHWLLRTHTLREICQRDASAHGQLEQLLAVERLVPWDAVARELPYAAGLGELPRVSAAQEGTLVDACRRIVFVEPHAAARYG